MENADPRKKCPVFSIYLSNLVEGLESLFQRFKEPVTPVGDTGQIIHYPLTSCTKDIAYSFRMKRDYQVRPIKKNLDRNENKTSRRVYRCLDNMEMRCEEIAYLLDSIEDTPILYSDIAGTYEILLNETRLYAKALQKFLEEHTRVEDTVAEGGQLRKAI